MGSDRWEEMCRGEHGDPFGVNVASGEPWYSLAAVTHASSAKFAGEEWLCACDACQSARRDGFDPDDYEPIEAEPEDSEDDPWQDLGGEGRVQS